MTAKEICSICGKRAKRYCPSLGANICSLCCGTKRGIEIDCSPECRFFPFAVPGYDLWLKLDGTIVAKLAERVIAEVGRDHFEKTMELFSSLGTDNEASLENRFYFALYHCLLAEKDAEGRTLSERWDEEQWEGLDRDEALMMKYRGKYFKKKLKFRREKIVDLARQVAEENADKIKSSERETSASPEEGIPPEVEAEILKRFYQDRYTRFLDEEIPALNGLTPRQAAADPESRELLLELMKEHLHGIESQSRSKGLDINIDFALKELGLEELIDVRPKGTKRTKK